MSIKVVCGCGFCTLLPSGWEGRRVKCKCGRTFIVGRTGGAGTHAHDVPPATGRIALPVAEPEPSAAVAHELPPAAEPELTPAADRVPPPAPEPTPSAKPAAVPQEHPLPPPATPADPPPANRPAHAADTRYRSRRAGRRRPPIALAFLTMLMALTSVAAVAVVLREHDWSITAMLGMENGNESSRSPSDVPGESEPAARVATTAASKSGASDAPDGGTPDAAAGSGEGTTTRLANLSDLISEDGLLLTGMFGEGSRRLGLNDEQQATIRGVAARLKENEQELKIKKLTLEQWYAACRKLGDESLAVLTDAQRQMLRAILERKEMQRVLLVEYSAMIVPELAVAQMPWSVPTAGRSFRTISQSSFTAPAQDRCYRASEPTGMFATLAVPTAGDAPHKLTVWDLIKDRDCGHVEVTSPGAEMASVLSRDGRHWVVVRTGEGAAGVVEVWSTEAGKLLGSKELPTSSDPPYTVRDCVAHRIVALAGQGYWVWDFESDKAQEIVLPESRPNASPCLAIGADGGTIVVAHPHITSNPPDECCVIEVCIYRLDTGELLGNQVFHKDYLRSQIGAIALSHDGRELALLWDFGPENPTRRLVHMHAGNGKVLKIIEGLPPADQGYARRHQLADRDLVWLPENAGWVVNLQNVVDAETGAVLPLELPVKGGTEGAAATEEVVEAVPAGDGRLLVIIADRPASPDPKAAMRVKFIDLPKLGPFQ